MTDTSNDIQERIDRLESIAETLEDGNVDLARAKELRDEADEHLQELRTLLQVNEGDVIEIDKIE